ncbi:MAG: hypothetical protein IPI66_06205 [Chitinophagaceae bacterium]|nr:hypothetical protein [Chitinophagaceae bacterium]
MLLLIGISLLHYANSQSFLLGKGKTKWEVGVNFGPSFFLGDLGGNSGKGKNSLKDLNLEFTKFMKGAFITMYPNDWLGFRVAADYTYLEGDDAVINTTGIDELWRKQRNLNFKSDVWEIYGALEVFPLQFLFRNRETQHRLRPYGLVGIGLFHFNPKGSLTDASGNTQWYKLQPLKTEGQGMAEYPYSKPYKLTQMNIHDFAKYMSAPNAALATQLSDKTIPIIYPGMTRWSSGTQRGDLKDADTYFSIVLKFGIKLGPLSDENSLRARQRKCPTVY